MKITPPDSGYKRTLLWKFQTPIYKKGAFSSFATRKITDAFLFVLFFPRSDRIKIVVLEDRERAHSNGN